MFLKHTVSRPVALFLMVLAILVASSGCNAIDDIPRVVSPIIDDVPEVASAIRNTGRASSGVIDELPELGSAIGAAGSVAVNTADDIDTIVLSLRGRVDELANGLLSQHDDLSAAKRQAIKGKLVGISCGTALNMAKKEDPPANVIEEQVYSALISEVGEAMAGEAFSNSLSIVYTLAQEVNNTSGGDPFQIDRICASISN